MLCFTCFFSRLFSLLVSTKQWSFATSTLFRLSWSTTGWLSRLRRLQNNKLCSCYSLLLTHVHCIAQYYSPTCSLYWSPSYSWYDAVFFVQSIQTHYSSHEYIVLRSITNPQVHCIVHPMKLDPPTPSLQLTLFIITTKIPKKKKTLSGKTWLWTQLLTHPHVVSIVDRAFLPIRSLGLCNSTCILHNGLIRRVSFLFLTSVEIIFQRSLLKQVELVNMSEHCST